MMRRALFAAAAACACLLAAPASAGTLDSYPIVTPGASDKLCGYANATGHATQCATAQTIANLAPPTPPGGSTGQIQFNNSSAFAGATNLTYCLTCVGGGPGVNITTAPLTLTTNSGSMLNIVNSSTTWFAASTLGAGGGQLFFNSNSDLNWANAASISEVGGVFDIGAGGAIGDVTGQMDMAYLTVGTSIALPAASLCNGTITSMLLTSCVPVLIRGPVPEPSLTAGEGEFYIDGSSRYIIAAHTMNAKAGAVLQGSTPSVTCTNTSGYGECWNSDLTLNTATGIPVAAVEDQGNWFAVGVQRALPCPSQGDQGCATQGTDYISQLILNDAVAGGTYSEPIMVFQSGDLVGGLLGIGHNAPSTIGSLPTYAQNVIRLGAVQDFNTGWDDNSTDQPDWGLAGCLSLGKANGNASANSGGVGITWDERLCDNAGLAEFYNTAKTVAVPIAAYFTRPTSGTLANLNTNDPSPADGDAGFISDATSCTFMSAVTGGGSTHCPVHYDSSSLSWKAG